MARPTKSKSTWNDLFGPLREYWRDINRSERENAARVRKERKARDKRRRKCRCDAYPWPHRPGGGFCRYPDPPVQRWQRKPGGRPYRQRYAGIVRQIARANGLHPIRDRAAILALMPRIVATAKEAKRLYPRAKYRNVEITENGIRAQWQSAGPMM
jgi:hypothetical protein